MSDSSVPAEGHNDLQSQSFQLLVAQQANMAFMFLGKVPHPETGETTLDLEAARVFIDTLEMLEAKTKGNLHPEEEQFLKQSLTSLRMIFVQVINQTPSPSAASQTPPQPSPSSSPPSPPDPPQPKETLVSAEAESRKKFTKKY